MFLGYVECAAFVQTSKQSPAEIYVLKELAFNSRQTDSRAINPELAFHGMVYGHFTGGRIVARVRCESDPHQSIFHAVVSKEKCVRNIFEELARLVRIALIPLLPPRPFLLVFPFTPHPLTASLPPS